MNGDEETHSVGFAEIDPRDHALPVKLFQELEKHRRLCHHYERLARAKAKTLQRLAWYCAFITLALFVLAYVNGWHGRPDL